ncbi:MAG: transglycosylase SLT domain-containing protein [Candidatus Aenigmarchaeota archaeon]|nr:transglycosylase SLT domain-containing protein [Candidatus Aenigmarchaeota archaeon]
MSIPQIIAIITLTLGIQPPNLLKSICYTESHFRNVINKDDGGSPSYGICQIKLETARMYDKNITAKDLMYPRINIWFAGLYLRDLLKKYDNNIRLGIAAYNAGGAYFCTSKGVTSRTKTPCEEGKLINLSYVNKVLEAAELPTQIPKYVGGDCFFDSFDSKAMILIENVVWNKWYKVVFFPPEMSPVIRLIDIQILENTIKTSKAIKCKAKQI